MSALMIAAGVGCANLVRLLLDTPTSGVHQRTKWGTSALDFAAQAGSIESASLLLARGARLGSDRVTLWFLQNEMHIRVASGGVPARPSLPLLERILDRRQ